MKSMLSRLVLPVGALTFWGLMTAFPVLSQAPDNTKNNKDQTTTADQQKMDPSDRAITQKIRKSIHDDKSLSTYAHNVKIITQNGKVTLRGPVRTVDEKNSIHSRAAAVAGEDNVTDELQVASASQ